MSSYTFLSYPMYSSTCHTNLSAPTKYLTARFTLRLLLTVGLAISLLI